MTRAPHGGPRPGAGRPPGSTGKRKPRNELRTIKKFIRFSPDEWRRVRERMDGTGYGFAELVRYLINQ